MKNRLAISKHETWLHPAPTLPTSFYVYVVVVVFFQLYVCMWGLQTHPDILTAGAIEATAAPGAGSVVSMVNKLLSRYFITSLVVSDSCEGRGLVGGWWVAGGVPQKGCLYPNPNPNPNPHSYSFHAFFVRECVQFFNLCDFWLPSPLAHGHGWRNTKKGDLEWVFSVFSGMDRDRGGGSDSAWHSGHITYNYLATRVGGLCFVKSGLLFQALCLFQVWILLYYNLDCFQTVWGLFLERFQFVFKDFFMILSPERWFSKKYSILFWAAPWQSYSFKSIVF